MAYIEDVGQMEKRIEEEGLKDFGIVIAFGFADYATSSKKGFMRLFEQADKKMYKRKDELKFKKLQIS